MGIRLTLDQSALTKVLAEDDGSISLELRQGILEEFAKRHIKNVANSKIINHLDNLTKKHLDEALSEAHKHLEEHIGEFVKKPGWNKGHTFILSERIKHRLEHEADLAFEKSFEETINKRIDEATNTIFSKMDRYIDRHMNRSIDEEIERRVDEKLATIRGAL